MKALEFGDDIWNGERLDRVQHEPFQSPKITQNKLRIDLIVFYLTLLDYTDIPSLNVLSLMTTPSNWSRMLHILYFLANNCLVYLIVKFLF